MLTYRRRSGHDGIFELRLKMAAVRGFAVVRVSELSGFQAAFGVEVDK